MYDEKRKEWVVVHFFNELIRYFLNNYIKVNVYFFFHAPNIFLDQINNINVPKKINISISDFFLMYAFWLRPHRNNLIEYTSSDY